MPHTALQKTSHAEAKIQLYRLPKRMLNKQRKNKLKALWEDARLLLNRQVLKQKIQVFHDANQ